MRLSKSTFSKRHKSQQKLSALRMTPRLTILLLLLTTTALAQIKSLDNYFAQIRAGKYANVPAEVSKPELASGLLKSLSVYATDTMPVVRARAAGLVRTIGLQSKVATVRTQAVHQLVAAAKDKDTGNSGVALNYIKDFRKNDFSAAAKDSLYAYFQRKSGNPSPQSFPPRGLCGTTRMN